MNKHHIKIDYQEYDNVSEIPESDRFLVEQAHASAEKAYARYSLFHVGAAVLLGNGEIILGNNQENAAYPSGLCAERVAIFYASANYPEQFIKAIAITAIDDKSALKTPPFPCGSCRQVLAEYEYRQKAPIRIILHSLSGKIIVVEGIDNLLPFPFVSK